MSRKKLLTIFILIVISLIVLGNIFQLSLHSLETLKNTRGLSYYRNFNKNIIIILFSFFFVFFNLPSHKFYKRIFPIILYIINLVALVLVLVINNTKKGANRWINLGFFTYQPSETAKLVLIMVLSLIFSISYYYISRKKKLIENLKKGKDKDKISEFDIKLINTSYDKIKLLTFMYTLVFFVPYAILIERSKSFSLTVQLTLIYIGMVSFSKYINFKNVMVFLGMIFAFLSYKLTSYSYRLNRLSGNLWHVISAKKIIRNGGINGVGYGNGIGRNFYLPEIENDYVFAGIYEEWGILSLLIMVLFIILIIIIFYVSSISKTEYDRMLALGIGFMIANQVILHFGINITLLPSTGVVLPFISSGGSAMVTNILSMSIIKNIILRIDDEKFKKEEVNYE